MGRSTSLLRSFGVLLFALLPLPAQDPPHVEVLAGPGRPSTLLGEWLEQHHEEFVIFDVGLLVQTLAGNDLGDAWKWAEKDRCEALWTLLQGIAGKPAPGSEDPCRGIAAIAVALMTGERAAIEALPETWRAEAKVVFAGRTGRLSLLPDAVEHDWADAMPTGAYVGQARSEGLFRATVYLRIYVEHMPDALRKEWNRRADAAQDDKARKTLQRVDATFAAMFGAEAPVMPGLIGNAEQPDRLLLPDLHGDCWQRLRTLFERLQEPRSNDLRARLLGVAHELAIETPNDPLLDALGRDRWRCKWLDAATYTYVALREVDPLLGVLGIPPDGRRPRLLVEPLPRTLAALRAAAAASDRVKRLVFDRGGASGDDSGTASGGEMVQLVDDLLALLAAQQAGKDVDAVRLDRLWNALAHWFDEEDPRAGVIASLDGISGGMRRSGVWLVRVPIRWQGQDKTALAFWLVVEHQEADGSWHLPPWGLELRPVAATASDQKAGR